MREPIFGYNAKAFFIQSAIGFVIFFTLYKLTNWWLPDMIRSAVESVIG